MSNGFGPIATLELSDGQEIFVGCWWTSADGGVELSIIVPGPDGRLVLNHGDLVVLIAALEAELSEFERSLIPEKLASLQRWREVEGCPRLSSEATGDTIKEHYRARWEAEMVALGVSPSQVFELSDG